MIRQRQRLFYVLIVGLLVTAASCGQPTPEVIRETQIVRETQVVVETQVVRETQLVEVTPVPTGAPVRSGTYGEAPMLAELVAAGELPAVEERLPKNPGAYGDMLPEQQPLSIGMYGGTYNLPLQFGPASWSGGDPWAAGNSESLLDMSGSQVDVNNIYGSIAESWEVSEDQREFTFRLREGMKWSDGAPVTSEDVRFLYDDVLNNAELTPVFPSLYTHALDGSRATLTVIDDYAFKYSFEEPYGGWLIRMAHKFIGRGATWEQILPAHYFKQFHTEYTPLADLEGQIDEAGFEPGEWWQLFALRYNETPEDANRSMPLLSPYIRIETSPTVTIFERNPYYWKVDAAGNQLPYVDTITFRVIPAGEPAQLAVTAGDVDFVDMDAVSIPVVLENKDRNHMDVLAVQNASSDDVYLNWTYDDPAWRQVVSDTRFREAFNLAIPRPALLEQKMDLADPNTLLPGDYDPERANALLDEVLPEKDPDGWRLGPDGQRFEIPIWYANYGLHPKVGEQVALSLQDVGIFSTPRLLEEGFFWEVSASNEAKAMICWGMTGYWPLIVPDWSPADGWFANFVSPVWNQWTSTQGDAGEEPPDWYQRLHEIYREVAVTGDMSAFDSNWDEVTAIWQEQYPYFTTFFDIQIFVVHKENLGNIPVMAESSQITWFPLEVYYWKPAE